MYAAVALEQMSEIAETVWQDYALAGRAKLLSREIRAELSGTGVVEHGKYGRVYALTRQTDWEIHFNG